MKKSYTFVSKSFVSLPRKTIKDKKINLNLNVYRNQKWNLESECKKQYKQEMLKQLKACPKFDGEVEVTFKMKRKLNKNGSRSKVECDKHNVYTIIVKYLYDAMTEVGIWKDDNDDIIKTETLLPTEYIKGDNNIIEITFTEI
tara:strand:- start:169 stop:597 length:429 start_codon:yes stop_codon:yes gene_type:complete